MSEATPEEVARPTGFVSYVHKDDNDAKGRVLNLIREIEAEFSLLTGEDLEIFVDRSSIRWGDRWRDKIDNALQDTTFFIPIITPRFFKSQECRNEFLKFAALARSLDAVELILPILFVNVDGLDEESDDEAVALVAQTQYVDWRELRLSDENSAEYRQEVNACAKRLAAVSAAYAARETVLPAVISGDDDDWDETQPGIVDLVAAVEQKMPRWNESITRLPAPTQLIGELVTEAGDKVRSGDAQGKTLGYRILVARDLADQLKEPTCELQQIGEEYVATLMDIDPGVRAVIALAEEQVDEDQKRAACEMFRSLLRMVESSRSANVAVQALIDSLQSPARQFKDLRRPLKTMRSGLRSVLDAQAIYDEWERLIKDSPLGCGDDEGDVGDVVEGELVDD